MRIAFYTLGCKVNQYETEALKQQFQTAGYQVVDPEQLADIYVVNSCTVTAEGDRKSRQALRRFRRKNPAAVTCLTGCYPQAFPARAEGLDEADIVTGSRDRAGLLAAVEQHLAGGGKVVRIVPHQAEEPFEPIRADASSRTRAFLKIEDGCDRRCAYCIIPTARGPVRSRPLDSLRAELEALAAARYREVVLTGINLSSYGRDLGLRLLDALELACRVPGIRRVRLGSLEPELLTGDDIPRMARLPELCPQFHLSLQSGCDETLRRMRRPYTAADYRRVAAELRAAFPGCALTTDLMVGFPGETDDEFRASLAFVREMAFAKVHVFPYSRRPGTAAAEMPGQIPAAEKARRARELSAAAAETRAAFFGEQIGAVREVLVERQVAPGVWEGYTPTYIPVRFPADGDPTGQILPVEIGGTGEDWCTGTLADEG